MSRDDPGVVSWDRSIGEEGRRPREIASVDDGQIHNGTTEGWQAVCGRHVALTSPRHKNEGFIPGLGSYAVCQRVKDYADALASSPGLRVLYKVNHACAERYPQLHSCIECAKYLTLAL